MIKVILIVTFLVQFIYGLDFGKFKEFCADGELLAYNKICLTKNYTGFMENPPSLIGSSQSVGSLIGNALKGGAHINEIRVRLNFIEMEDVQILQIGIFRVLSFFFV